MIYGYLRTSRAAVDGLAGMHPETQLQALADAGVELATGYLRTSRAAVDGLAGMHPETQLQALADAGVELANIFQDVGISGSVLVSDRPGWTELDTKLIRGDTVTVAALDRISRNRLDLVGVVESLHRRGVGIASLAPAESWLHPLSAHPTEVEQMIGEIILRVMAWAAQAELESIKRRIAVGIRRAAEEGRFPGRPRALTPEQTSAVRLLRRSGQSQSAVARTFGVSRQTIWRAEQSE